MKYLRILASTIILSMLAVAAHAGDSEDAVSGQVTGFYKAYLHALKGEGDTMAKTRVMQKRFISERFLREIERAKKSEDGLEADPFILAQDFDDEWEKTLKIKEVLVHGDKATAGLELTGSGMGTRLLEIKLLRARDAWKIDKIRELDTHAETHIVKP